MDCIDDSTNEENTETKETVRLLLEKGADPNIISNDGDTALIQAITEENTETTETVRLLLENGANPNIISQYAYQRYGTALQAAKYYGAQDVVELLERHIMSTKIQSIIRGRQRRNKIKTQKASQQSKASLLPVEYDVSEMIGERLSKMPYNPEVAKRIKHEDENERIADYLKTLAQYGGKKKHKKLSGKRKLRKNLRNRNLKEKNKYYII